MGGSNNIHVAPSTALTMVGNYARQRLLTQIRALAFIVLYLVAFQILALGTTPSNAWRVALGIGMVLLGLTLFLEGIMLGLMPLGERVGLKLPQHAKLGVIVVFGLLLGLNSTLAEPAIAALRSMGGNVKAWEAPLLYSLLENDPEKLVIAIGMGVGIAVAVGMIRLYFGMSIKPFVYVLVPLLLAVSLFCAMNENLAPLLGLAWDTGAVTTGPVTVPLVMALGIGVSRSICKHNDGSGGGFGIIMLASAFPVLAVLSLGMFMNPTLPRAMPESEFFKPEHRALSMRIFPTEAAMLRHAYQRGSETARMAYYENADTYRQAIRSLADPDRRHALLGGMPLSDWLRHNASESEEALLSGNLLVDHETRDPDKQPLSVVMRQEAAGALRSVIPLTALLLVTMIFFLRDSFRHNDEIALGIIMSLAGMALLTAGIRTGLAPLGDEAGRSLPRMLSEAGHETERILLKPFDVSQVFVAYGQDGAEEYYFYFRGADGTLRSEPFDSGYFDPETGSYEHVVKSDPVFPGAAGIGLVFLFAFGLGYGSTLAEPALNALGRKIEEISVGTIKRAGVVRAVSMGVGLGLVAGVTRILYDVPTLWLIAPPYLFLLWLTSRSEEDFAGLAWDCGGVTTGPVTVPLVMAMGLGIGGELNIVDGFGTLAMASVYPIVTVLIYGLVVRARQRRSIRAAEDVDDE